MVLTIWDIALFIVFVISVLLLYATWNVNFYQRKGIKTLPTYPIAGNMGQCLMKNEHFVDSIDRAYHTFQNEKYFGFYQFQKPFFVIKDIESIKQVTIKDFDHFQDHTTLINEDTDPLFGRNLFALKGRKWRDMRATLSPAFTSSKMKNMFTFVAECGEVMAKYYSNKIQIKNNEILEIEMKDAFTRYTNDVIATSAFGVKVDSFNEPNNEFYSVGKVVTAFGVKELIKIFGFTSIPAFMKLFKITLFGSKMSNFFRNLVWSQMKTREENNIIRPDMIHLLMEARKGSLHHDKNVETPDTGFATVEESDLGKQKIKFDFGDDDIVAQAVLFFFAGFDTSSTLLSFMTHELAINTVIQKTLQNEIDEVMAKCDGKPGYTDIQNMKYMDMVISETLRKWPPGLLVDRVCNKSYKIPGSNNKTYQLNPGDGIWIPIYSIHRDPKYYDNPEEFIPERFSEENKSSIKPFSYLPFGLGPRNCIGSRFALMEIKSVMFHMLAKFDFVETSKTTKPLKLDKTSQRMEPPGGFCIGLKSRQ